MNSRDRLVESSFSAKVQAQLEAHLKAETSIQAINEMRLQQLIRNNMADNKPLADALKKVIKNTKFLESLLDLGLDLGSNSPEKGNTELNPLGLEKNLIHLSVKKYQLYLNFLKSQ